MVGIIQQPPGRIERIEVEDFKSYRGFHIIGPFKNFTAVIGPNGSGKSNLMDAISFVLGVRTAHLRGSLKELLYRGGNSDDRSAASPNRCMVRLVYITGDGGEIQFARYIVPSSSSETTFQSQYKIDNRTVTWDTYNAKLKSFGILVKARNFLVFQGDIESVAAMNPKELTALFEAVSGSEALRKDYEEAQAAMVAAEERTALLSGRRKLLNQEKKQKKEQKLEAEKHLHLQEQLDDLKVEYYLWQLYHIDQEVKSTHSEKARQQSDVDRMEQAHAAAESKVKAKRAEAAGFLKQRMLLERKAAKKRAQIEKKSPQTVQVKEEIMRLSKRVKVAERDLEDKHKQASSQQEKIARLEDDLQKITAAQQQLEEDLKREEEEGGLQLDEGLLNRHAELKEEAASRTSKLAQDLDTASTRQKADEESLRTLKDTVTSITSRLEQLENDKAEALQQTEELRQKIKEAKTALEERKAESNKIAAKNRQAGAQREFLTSKLDDVEGKLKEAKADRRQGERERKMKDALVKMKQLFPGVHGRVTELASATSSRYNIALAVLLGRDMDSIIVDSETVAKDCIKFLKDTHVPPMTFYPLQTIRAKPVNERLRQIGGTAKLVLDVLEYDSAFERAFLSICGNTLVCDTQEEAKRLAFGTERHKVVALDGTLINKAGVMTGGLSRNLEFRAQRWDEKVTGSLKEERARYVRELADLPMDRDAVQVEQQLSGEIAGLERQAEYLAQNLVTTQERTKKLDAEIAALDQERQKQEPGLAKLQQAVEDRTSRITKLETRINEIKDRIFASFSKQVGVANIREFEARHLERADKASQERAKLMMQASNISSQLKYEKRSAKKDSVKALQEEITLAKTRLKELRKEEETLAQTAAEVIKELSDQMAEVAALNASAEKTEKEASELRKAAARHQKELAALKRALGSHDAALDQLRTRRADILKAAAMDQVELPKTHPKMDGTGVQPMDEADPGAGNDNTGAAVEYSGLKRARMAAHSPAERDTVDAEFRASIEELASTLERTAPNLKAVEQYEAIREREADQAAELEEARAAAKAAIATFNIASRQRFDLFMTAFDHVAAAIDPTFKELTKSRLHPVGGQAYLSLEDSEQPFLSGIKFTAMPPTKRYREMDQLSGGEKTVAALALLFAIHSFQPSPFFVLDEIDAALDAVNVARIANYIRERTRDGAPGGFQSIVISLKDIFFEKADALVGVSRNPDHGASTILTFDLNRHGEL